MTRKKRPAKDDVAEHMREHVAEFLNVPASDVTNDSRLADDLGADSLDVMELIITAEEDFDIAIEDEDADRVVTFADLVALIQKQYA